MNEPKDANLKAERRESKKRPRMRVHGQSLKRPNKHAGLAVINKQVKK